MVLVIQSQLPFMGWFMSYSHFVLSIAPPGRATKWIRIKSTYYILCTHYDNPRRTHGHTLTRRCIHRTETRQLTRFLCRLISEWNKYFHSHGSNFGVMEFIWWTTIWISPTSKNTWHNTRGFKWSFCEGHVFCCWLLNLCFFLLFYL